ncbi:hypothetical protein GALMADRAFT_155820 [Galerina marginata CBS 339.88]|uniref:Uncharacterized protein n=1 Tax=Galerina marginata (strain CBS 339.88) TaxID=685588 RepID=A0A067TB95_GALM3|nr:hypothetical protein GALMADRAFT_155820 [Galerina marginata CBS 339.88]
MCAVNISSKPTLAWLFPLLRTGLQAYDSLVKGRFQVQVRLWRGNLIQAKLQSSPTTFPATRETCKRPAWVWRLRESDSEKFDSSEIKSDLGDVCVGDKHVVRHVRVKQIHADPAPTLFGTTLAVLDHDLVSSHLPPLMLGFSIAPRPRTNIGVTGDDINEHLSKELQLWITLRGRNEVLISSSPTIDRPQKAK